MKNIFFAGAVLAFCACNSKSGNTFSIDGTISNGHVSTVYLEENAASQAHPVVIDSARVSGDGHFVLNTVTREEGLYSIRADQSMFPFAIVVSDAKKITVHADLSKSGDPSISGSPASQDVIDLDKKMWQGRQVMYQLAMKLDSLS